MNRSASLRIALAALALVPALGLAAGLDGRRFEGVFLQRGETSDDADTLIFREGRVGSIASDRYGYSETPYKASAAGDVVHIQAETESPSYGNLLSTGVVRGGKLDASAMSVRRGEPPVENWVVAGEKK